MMVFTVSPSKKKNSLNKWLCAFKLRLRLEQCEGHREIEMKFTLKDCVCKFVWECDVLKVSRRDEAVFSKHTETQTLIHTQTHKHTRTKEEVQTNNCFHSEIKAAIFLWDCRESLCFPLRMFIYPHTNNGHLAGRFLRESILSLSPFLNLLL